MTMNRPQSFAEMTTRQKATAVATLLVVIAIIWWAIGAFTGKKASTATNGMQPTTANAMQGGAPTSGNNMPPSQPSVQQAQLPSQPLTDREAQLMRLQQETEAKYLAAVSELQVLKVQKEIADANKSIMTAKLDTVTAEKGIVDALTKPAAAPVPTGAYAQGLMNQGSSGATPVPAAPPTAAPVAEVTYSVISVSNLQSKWGAVLGYEGKLYNVTVGDVLPADGSTVLTIDRSGVLLEKNGERKKISLIPII